VQGRIADAGFAGELLESEVTPAFAEELSELLCQSICHDRNLDAERVPQVGYFALRTVLKGVKMAVAISVFMADIKFECPECKQHLAIDAGNAGMGSRSK
jgi:hypothetical protein